MIVLPIAIFALLILIPFGIRFVSAIKNPEGNAKAGAQNIDKRTFTKIAIVCWILMFVDSMWFSFMLVLRTSSQFIAPILLGLPIGIAWLIWVAIFLKRLNLQALRENPPPSVPRTSNPVGWEQYEDKSWDKAPRLLAKYFGGMLGSLILAMLFWFAVLLIYLHYR